MEEQKVHPHITHFNDCGCLSARKDAEISALHARVSELEAENQRMREALEKDSSGLAAALGKIRAEVKARRWIVEGRGSYEWDDEQYRRETGLALDAIEAIADSALSASGKLVFESLNDIQTYDNLRAALEPLP